jgi:RNA polymerase sigma-70 factor (ECF subfamily)
VSQTLPDQERTETTELLREWGAGNPEALNRLMPRVYRELRRIAGRLMRNEGPGRTLQATALVNEAYLKLAGITNINWEHRVQFLAIAAQVMRRILLEAARKRATAKRGGQAIKINLEEVPDFGRLHDRTLIALDDALTRLAEYDIRKAQVVELRFFGGLSVDEIAAVLKISSDTVTRDWTLARGWLLMEIKL